MPALNEKQSSSRQTNGYLLSGLLKCGQCGASMIVSTRKNKGTTYRYYACSNYYKNGRSACSQQNLKAERYEHEVIIDMKDEIALALMLRDDQSTSTTEDEMKLIHEEIAKIDKQLDGLNKDTLELFKTRNLYNSDQYIFMNEQLKHEMDELSVRKQSLVENSKGQNNCDMRELMEKFICSSCSDMHDLKHAFKILIKEIIVSDKEIAIEYNFKR